MGPRMSTPISVHEDANEETDGTSHDTLPSTSVCKRCQGITIDSVCAGRGYNLSSVKALSLSAKCCSLCGLTLGTQGLKAESWFAQPFDRYQI